jgi:hypothetical protein
MFNVKAGGYTTVMEIMERKCKFLASESNNIDIGHRRFGAAL